MFFIDISFCILNIFEKYQREAEKDKRQSDIDEAVLLKDWDFARFFPSKNAEAKEEKQDTTKEAEQRRAQLQRQSRIEMEDAWAKYKAIATPPLRHKQLFQKPTEKSTQDKLSDILKYKKEQDTESNGPNRFFRGFRRENSDLFPLSSTRHSAIYYPKHDNQTGANKQLRSSGIFNHSRKQTTKPQTSGEPILTDFIKMNDSLKKAQRNGEKKMAEKKVAANNPIDALKSVAVLIRQGSEDNNSSRQSSLNSDSSAAAPDLTATRPRREKTESDIVFRRNSQYNRHSDLIPSGQEAVIAQDQVIPLCSG